MSYIIDDVARSLAGPMPRRNALKIFGGLVLAALGVKRVAADDDDNEQSCRPRCSSAQHCCKGVNNNNNNQNNNNQNNNNNNQNNNGGSDFCLPRTFRCCGTIRNCPTSQVCCGSGARAVCCGRGQSCDDGRCSASRK